MKTVCLNNFDWLILGVNNYLKFKRRFDDNIFFYASKASVVK